MFIFVLIISCSGPDSSNGSANPKYSHYNIELSIDPEGQFIKANGNIKYLVEKDSLDSLSFNLHKRMNISLFTINGEDAYILDTISKPVRWIPEAIKIVCSPDHPLLKGEIINIEFSYEGSITEWSSWSANVIGPEWVEMGLYFPWYPSFEGLFTYNLAVDIDPDYNVFAVGKAKDLNNRKLFENDSPVYDFIICASKDLRIRETTLLNQSFQIANATLSESTIDTMQADIESFYQLYHQWFGEIPSNDMFLVVSKREKGGGYARTGGLVLGGINDSVYFAERIVYERYLGHEIAHFWWHGAKGNWEDWLNESFAEYSAMMLIRELIGEGEFNARIKKKIEASSNTAPIWGLERNDPSAELVLYGKGVVLLNELEEKIGMQSFLELCQKRISEKINSTSSFLYLIHEQEGEETRDWFEQALKTR